MLKSNFLKFSPGGLHEIAWQSQLDSNAWLGVMFKIITTLNTLSFSYITWKMLHACRAWSPCQINHSFTNAVFLPSLISLWERSHLYGILFLSDSRQSETWHFWFKFPTPPRQRSNSWVLPRYKWWSNAWCFPRGRGMLKFWISGIFSPSNSWYNKIN